MKKILIMLAALFAFQCMGLCAEHATPSSKNVVELISFVSSEKTDNKPLLWKKERQFSGATEYLYQSVIISAKERITLQYFPNENPKMAYLAIWWRLEGSGSQASLFFASVGLDGKVSSGSGPEGDKKRFQSDYHSMGEEYYWQEQLDSRVNVALEFYRNKK
jgi:hypothetical protein